MALVRKALSFRRGGRYNVQEAKENRFPTSSYKRIETLNSEEKNVKQNEQTVSVTQVSETVRVRMRRGGQSDSSLKVASLLRNTFGSIRQKMRSSIRRRKRLNSAPNTPASTLRRSMRIQNRTPREPNVVESPQSVRLNRFQPKRCNFSSPGQLHRDIDAVSHGIQSLSNVGKQTNKIIERQNR